jgi:hypothetical protein
VNVNILSRAEESLNRVTDLGGTPRGSTKICTFIESCPEESSGTRAWAHDQSA